MEEEVEEGEGGKENTNKSVWQQRELREVNEKTDVSGSV